jgi:hypothetical protein
MHNTNVLTLRRSSRLPITVPVLVTSLQPGANFSEVCETMVVSAHGCAMRSPVKLEAGVPLHFHNREGRETTAQVVYCRQSGTDRQAWTLGARFDRPENFWGLKSCPKDWAQVPVPAGEKPAPSFTLSDQQAMAEQVVAASAKIVLDRIRQQLSDEHLRAVFAELLRPLEAEVTALKEKLAQGAKRSKFEVSLTQIPPELEQQLEFRLRRDLGPQVLKEAREQSEQVLEAAKSVITQKTTQTHDEFRQRVANDLQAVEQRTQSLSMDIAQNLREHLNRGLGELHQEVVDAGNRLKQLSQELVGVMQHALGEEHDSKRRHLEQVQAVVKSESARLQTEIGDLDRRMAKLDESACNLESGLDKRLSQMASDTVRTARSQMEGALEATLNELSTRAAQELSNQLNEASSSLIIIQKEMETSASDSLRLRSAEGLQSFEHRMDELAQQSVERWRVAFAGGLNSLARILGEQFVLQAANGDAGAQTGSNDKPRKGARS